MAFTLTSFLVEYGLRIATIVLFVGALGFLLGLSTNCIAGKANAFEPFEDAGSPTLSDYTRRTRQLDTVKDTLSDTIGELDDLVDETCGIVGHVKDAYIGNNSAPLDETEYTYPKDVQKKRLEQRKVRAAKRFEDDKAVFGTIAKKTLLECFENGSQPSEKDIALKDAQQDLATAVDEVGRILDTAQLKAALLKSQQLAPTLQFTAKYLKQAGDAVSSAPPVTMETFVDAAEKPPSGAELIASADALLKRAADIRKTIQDLKQTVQQQKEAVKTLNRLQSQGITPPS